MANILKRAIDVASENWRRRGRMAGEMRLDLNRHSPSRIACQLGPAS
jgi:hypothetical protein